MLKKKKPVTQNPEAQMELVEHLAELRGRLFRSVIYIIVVMVLTYNFFSEIYTIFEHPLKPILAKVGGETVVNSILEPFMIRMQVCFISGLVLAMPFVILELWGFIAPALTPDERKPVVFLAPFSVLLFLSGVGTAYACLPTTYAWMASYVPDIGGGVRVLQGVQQYLLLTVKLLLAFGIAFQLPLVLLFLAKVGIITADLMTKYWRHAVVGISVVAAILTPSNDPLTMLMMAVPMAGLYIMSIGLVRAFEPKEDGSRGLSLVTMLLVALTPVGILAAVGYWLWRTHGGASGI